MAAAVAVGLAPGLNILWAERSETRWIVRALAAPIGAIVGWRRVRRGWTAA